MKEIEKCLLPNLSKTSRVVTTVKNITQLSSRIQEPSPNYTYNVIVSFHTGFRQALIVFVFFFTLSESPDGINLSLT